MHLLSFAYNNILIMFVFCVREESIEKEAKNLNFQKICIYGYFMKNILPTMNVVNVRSLKLHKANEIRHFFSIYSLNSLIQLRLLSLTFMYSFNDNSFTFWNQLSSLKYLRSL